MKRAIATAIALLATITTSAHAAWHQPVGGPSPINRAADQSAQHASLTSINGVPYVAWYEYDDMNSEIRVARLSADGASWESVGETVDPASPINRSPTRPAINPSIVGIDGVPYVAWSEEDSLSYKIHVARLNAAGTDWEMVGATLTPAGPINQSLSRNALDPSLIAIGGVPYVAWRETDDTNFEIRVARLNAAGTGWEKVATSASPINQAADKSGSDPELTAIDGVPYVAWRELDAAGVLQIRVARLNATQTAWEKVGQDTNPASPINQAPNQNARHPTLAAIGGVPYVAWDEEAASAEIRVARLNAAGTAWEKIGGLANVSAASLAQYPSLAAIDGIPYLAWGEFDGSNTEIRAARLNAAGTAWEQVAGSASPINEAQLDAEEPSITAIDGVPFVAWSEAAAGTGIGQIHASRLEPEFIGQTAAPAATTATLTAEWRTFGVRFPIGFNYGASLESSTTPELAPAFAETATVSQRVSGLAEQSPFQFRSFATAGTEPRLLGEVGSFVTADGTAPETTITKDPKAKSSKTKAKYKFTSSEPNSTFVCKFDKKKPKPCDAGKLKLKRLDDGKHKFRVYAVDAAGNADSSPAKDKFKVL